MIDAATAETGEHAIGDAVSIITEIGGKQDFDLVGIASFGDLDNLGGARTLPAISIGSGRTRQSA